MAKQARGRRADDGTARAVAPGRPSVPVDLRISRGGDCLGQLSSEPRPPGSGPRDDNEDGHASAVAHIDYVSPRCVELARVLKETGSVQRHRDWHRRYGNRRRALGTG